MFDKLRNRFLIVNMVTISLIMIAAFGFIFTIMDQNVRKEIDMELRSVSKFYGKPERQDDWPLGPPHIRPGNSPSKIHSGDNPPPGLSLSFIMIADKQWTLLGTSSLFDMNDEFYKRAKAEIVKNPAPTGRFSLDDRNWAYTLQEYRDGYAIVSLDVTSQTQFIANLVYTFIIVGLVMLIVIYGTSRFFANRSIAPVKEAFDKQKQFIADASHELKTPLAVIDTNADVLLASGEDTIQSQSKWLHHIKSEADRMKTLTNDLLYLTEINDGRIKMIHAPFSVSEAVESVTLTMEAVLFEKELSLQYDVEPGLSVRGNSEQMKQVVMILLDNALKYTNANGSIVLSLKKRHHDAWLTISNTGEGIPPEHLGLIFDRFYRVESSRSRKLGGYGLGLAIAKSIVEQHKGKIHVKSVPGDKTTFSVQLPLYGEQRSDAGKS
ncbi:sensor histidine kinase [Paenibacillus sp. GCM10027627]|uniref:sensor histidine kinase n=1 Tax=unclassified Paenibacillus TaxID=185978 RepID=UPI0036450933